MANADVKIGVGLNIDKTGLNELKTALQAIQQEAAKASGSNKMTKELKESAKAAQQLEKILDSAWNSKLQQFNLNKVNSEIKTAYGGVNNLKVALEKSGSVGASAYNKVASSLLTTNMQLKQSNKLLDSMAVSMANTVKWGITSSIFNNMTQSIQKAWSYSKNLNTSLNDIRIVTGESAEKMDQFAEKANKAAKELGKSTLDYTKASLIYYQQGLSDEDVAARAETTLKAANVTGQSGEAVSEQLTAVWNGYKVSAEEAELYIDKLAAVAATTAADLEELSTGMSKVASAADLMGVDIDQLNAQMATIVSVTRQAPESVGTALKTIYARMGDIEAGLDSETTLGHYTEEMKAMGVNVLDANGKLRDMGSVIEEIGGKWQGMSREQQIALSQTMAGTRQYNNLLSLFDNWDMYTKALNTSANAAGTLQEQQETYMESTAAHLQQLRTETQRTYDLMFNPDTVNGMIDALDGGLEFFNNFIEGIDGGGHALLLLGSIAANVFDKQIAGSLLRVQNNLQMLKLQLKDTVNMWRGKEGAGDAKKQWIETQAAAQVNMNNAVSGVNVGDAGLKAQQQAANEILKVQKGLTQEQYQQSLEINKQIGLMADEVANREKASSLTEKQSQLLREQGLTQQSSTRAINDFITDQESELANLQEGRAIFQDTIVAIERCNQGLNTMSNVTQQIETNEQEIKNALLSIGLDTEETEWAWTSIKNKIAEGTLSIKDFETFIGMANIEEDKTNQLLQIGNILLNQRNPEFLEALGISKEHLRVLREQNGEIAKQGSANIGMQKMVNVGMAAVGVISSLTGAMSVLGDETAGTEQKVHAVGSAFSGVSMAIGSAFGPTGMVIGGIIGALGSLVSQLDFVEDAFKSTEERMAEFKEQQQELISDAERFRAAKNSLSEVAEEYENLAEKANADNYDSNIDDLTKEERARYNELKGIIIEYNEDAVIAHNAEGEAILAKNAGIQETIDLLKEQYELEAGQKISENWADQNETKEKELKEATEGQQGAQTRVDEYSSPEGKLNLDATAQTMIDDAYSQILHMTSYLEDEEGKIQQAFKDLTEAYADGQLTESDIDTYLDSIKTVSDADTKNLQVAAKRLRDGITYTQDEVARANDELAAANIELEKAQHVDVSHILNAVKYVEGYNEGYDKLKDLDIEIVDVDALITNFAESLEFGEDGDTYEELSQKVNEYANNLYKSLSQLENPEEIFAQAQELEPYNFNSVKEYNQGVLDKINEIIESNKEQFETMGAEQKKALFEALFGVEGLEFNEEDLADKVNTGYKKKRENLIPTIEEDYGLNTEGNDLPQINKEDLVGLSPEQIDNFSQLEGYIDRAKIKTEGWAAALEDAGNKADIANEKSRALSDLSTEGAELGFSEEEIQTAKDLTEEYLELAKSGEVVNEALADNPELAKEMAKEAVRVSKAIEELRDNWDDYSEALKEGAGDPKYVKAMSDLKKNLEGILDVSGEDAGWLTDDFIAENMDDIKAAAEGSQDAIDRLRVSAAEEIITEAKVEITPENMANFQSQTQEILGMLDEVANEDIQVGASIDDSQYATQLFNMMNEAGYTAQQISDAFNSIGWEPEVEQRTYTLTDKDVRNGSIQVPSMVDAETGTVDMQTIPIESTATVGSTISYTVIKGKNGKSGFTPNMSKKASASTSAPKSSGKKGGGKKGGGGSKKKKEELVETEKDRYHDVNVRLKQIDKELEDIGKDQEKYFGKDLIKALNKELDILEKQKKAYKDKLKIAKEEQKELQKSLKADGVKFNSDGTIANYEKALQAQENALNKLIDKYNKLPASKQEKFKEEVLDPAKEEFEKFQENIERYDEVLLDEIPDIEDSLQEIADREIEINVQKLKMEVELRLDLSEAQKDWNEFQREVLDGIDSDDILGNAQADKALYETLLSNGTLGAETNKIGNIMQAIKDIDSTGTSAIYGDNKALAMEDLKAAMDELMGSMTDLNELKKNIDEAYLDMIDKTGEAFDEHAESLEYINGLIEHNINLTELLHGDDAYAEMAKHYQDMENNNLAMLASQRAAADYYKQMMETETDPEAIKKWQDLWKEATDNINATVEASVENLIDKYMNAIDLAFDTMKEKFAFLVGDKGSDYYSLEWEFETEQADKYLGSLDKAYELQKLQNKYKKSIDETSSVKAQRELNKLMDEEMKKLREKDKLTQYDIDRANAKYELRLKEIALEEAQQNKSQMRLRRDSSGNYSYQFVADEQAIADAQQDVADATHSLFQMDEEEAENKAQEALEILQKYNEKWKQIDKDDKEAQALLEQQFKEEMALINADWLAINANLYESAFMDRALLYDEDIATYQAMSDAEREIFMNQMVPTWNTGVREMMDAMSGPQGLGPICEQLFTDLKAATEDYNTSLGEVETTSGRTFDATKEQYEANIELAKQLVGEAEALITKAQEELTAVGELKEGVDTLAESYAAVYKNATDAFTAAKTLWEEQQRQAAEEAKKNNPEPGKNPEKDPPKNPEKDPPKTPDPEPVKDSGEPKVGKKVTYESGKYYYTSAGDSPTGTKKRGKKVYITKIKKGAKYPIHISTGSSLGSGDLGWLKEKQLKFDTGGYTGDWAGNDGKTAILHKKELVLNAKDTENILATVNIVRDMQTMINSLNDSIISRTSGMMNSIGSNLDLNTTVGTDLNQQVSIQASFPGVSSRAEIEQAFENLVNMASQHAYNTRR